MWSMLHANGMTPALLTRPYVGLSPVIPQLAAGMRIEQPVSDPSVRGQMSNATATAEPLLEPPGTQFGSHGFRQLPKCGFSPVKPNAHSCILSLPIQIAPTLTSFLTMVESCSATRSAKT